MNASGRRLTGTTAAIDDVVRRRVGRPWCLFLDRDGVINTRIVGGYVRTWDKFRFEPGALEALRVLAHWSPRIVVVTNQQGIGKGLMTREDLERLHVRMVRAIEDAGGRIDDIRYCPHLDAEGCECRKPAPGMATGYLDENPDLDGSLSVMVGDTASDVEMGRRLAVRNGGGTTVRIHTDHDPAADHTSSSLAAFATEVQQALDDHSAE